MLPVQDAITEPVKEPAHYMAILGKEGDTKIIWDPDNRDEVSNAERTFDDLKKKGFTAYAVKSTGEKADKLTKFDAKEGKIIMVPRMVGG